MTYDAWLQHDVVGEQSAAREAEVERVIEQVMNDPLEMMRAIGDDSWDVLYEIVCHMTADKEPGEDPGDWTRRKFFDAERVLLRRARHYAEQQVDA